MAKSIAEEIGQKTPFRSRSYEAVASLIRTTSDVKRVYEDLMATRGITLQQYNVLRILRGAGEPIGTMDLGDRLMDRTPGITRLIDRLERKGFITRTRSPHDRRQVICALTQMGRSVLAGLDSEVDRLDEEVISALSEKETGQFVDFLDRIRSSLPR